MNTRIYLQVLVEDIPELFKSLGRFLGHLQVLWRLEWGYSVRKEIWDQAVIEHSRSQVKTVQVIQS